MRTEYQPWASVHIRICKNHKSNLKEACSHISIQEIDVYHFYKEIIMEERHNILNAVHNPLSIIALFVLSIEVTATVAMANSSLTENQRYWLVAFITIFPVIVFIAFFLIAWFRPVHFYGPQDYSDSRLYLQAMKRGKIEDEVEEIVNSAEGQTTESRMQAASWLSSAERLVKGELLKEFNCPMSQQVLSEDGTYIYDAVIYKGRRWICVDIKYVSRPFISAQSLDQVRRFAKAAQDNTKILAIVTPEHLNEKVKEMYRSKIDEIDNTIELRFYKL